MEELTFNDLPKAVSQLLLEIKEIKEFLSSTYKCNFLGADNKQ